MSKNAEAGRVMPNRQFLWLSLLGLFSKEEEEKKEGTHFPHDSLSFDLEELIIA